MPPIPKTKPKRSKKSPSKKHTTAVPPAATKGDYAALPDAEERDGLLYDAEAAQVKLAKRSSSRAKEGDDDDPYFSGDDELDAERRGWSRRKIVCTAVGLIVLLVAGAMTNCISRTFGLSLSSWWESSEGVSVGGTGSSGSSGSGAGTGKVMQGFGAGETKSNGTHEFKRTVVMVSIDGLRADYLDRGLTPHLLDISKQGLRAKSMKPIWPTLTFPNHWALMTGLHAESHGIVANNFWDPDLKEEFHYNQVASAWKSEWWLGEPMWETAEKAGITTANLMWPGPPKMLSGASSTYFMPWKDKVPLDEKLAQIMSWIDLPFDERPQLILAYEPSLDQAGHAKGPNSKAVNETLVYVDTFAKNLRDALHARNLDSIVDIIFVSDHGMTDTSHPTLVYMDDILGPHGLADIEHMDGWPAMGLRFHPSANVSQHLEALQRASSERAVNSEGREGRRFNVYTGETMPERYHFSAKKSRRIAEVYVVPEMGWVLTTQEEGDGWMSKGNHGYDNDEPSMHAMFVAHGPFSHDAKMSQQRREMSGLARRRKEGWHSTSEGAYVMETFRNVEVYNLVMKLLGVNPKQVAPTNGTTGFWDMYL